MIIEAQAKVQVSKSDQTMCDRLRLLNRKAYKAIALPMKVKLKL